MGAQSVRTRWGGLAEGGIAPAGFFRTAQIDGVWWLIDPDGGRFLSKGVNNVRFEQDAIQNTTDVPYAEACRRKYGGIDVWRAAVAQRLLSWGFNSLGAWSDEAVGRATPFPLALTPNLDLGAVFAWRRQGDGEPGEVFPDVFDPEFEIHTRRRALELCAPWRDDPSVIGWFTDNELRWGPDWRGNDELLTIFLNLRSVTAGRRAAIHMLQERYGDFACFNGVWRTAAPSWDELAADASVIAPYPCQPIYARNEAAERQSNAADPRRAAFVADCDAFTSMLADRYFEITRAAVNAADPNHLVLRMPLCLCANARGDRCGGTLRRRRFVQLLRDRSRRGARLLCGERQAVSRRRVFVSRR